MTNQFPLMITPLNCEYFVNKSGAIFKLQLRMKIKNRPPWMAVENLLAGLLLSSSHLFKIGRTPQKSATPTEQEMWK